MRSEKLTHFAFLILLLAAGTYTFFTYSPIALYFQDSDFAALQLVAHSFIEGKWTPFYVQQPYGGTLLTPLRTLWMWALAIFTHQSPFTFSFSQSFNYFALPTLCVFVIYFYLKRICSQRAAFLVALLFASGQPYWMTYVGCEFYWASLLLGFYFMAVRTRISNPWRDLSLIRFGWMSLLTGISLYTHRVSVVFIIPFFIPNGTLGLISEKVRTEKSSVVAQTIFKISSAFALFFIYIFVSGPNLGTLFGKKIKLHADANLQISVLLLCGWLLWIFRTELNRIFRDVTLLKRAGILILGTGIGLLPEFLYYRFQTGHVATTNIVNGMATSEEMVKAFLFDLPRAVRELASGPDTFAPDLFIRNLAFLFWFLSAHSLFKSFRKNTHVDWRQEPFVIGIILSVFSFVCLKTYTHAPTRYLFLITVFMTPAMGLWIDSKLGGILTEKIPARRVLLIALFLAVLGGQFAYYYGFAKTSQTLAQKFDVPDKYYRVTKAFQKTSVRVVLAEDYAVTNLFTLVAERKPYFITNSRILGPFEAFELAKSEERVGLLLWGTERGTGSPVSILNRNCVITEPVPFLPVEKEFWSSELTGSGLFARDPKNPKGLPLRGWIAHCK